MPYLNQPLTLLFRCTMFCFAVVAISSGLLLSVRGAMVDVPAGGYEGDVSTRTVVGKGSVGIADWVLLGRFVSGAETPQVGAEFQRADVAPKETKGDGRLTIADWVQAGRYATGLEPLIAAGGPTAPRAGQAAAQEAARDLRIVQTNIVGNTLNLSIEYEAAGNENAFGFSVNFDPTVLGSPSATLGSGMGGGTMLVNTLQAGQGFVGFAIALPSPNTVTQGVRQLATLSFSILKVGRTTQLGFGNQPVGIEIVGADTTVLPAPNSSTQLTVAINNPVPTLTSLNPSSAIVGGTLSLTVTGTNFNETSVINIGGLPRATTYVSATQLQAFVFGDLLANAGSTSITVTNPAPGGGTTDPLTLNINNPAPVISSIDPATLVAGSRSSNLTVLINGSGFVPSSELLMNGVKRGSYVAPTLMQLFLSPAEFAEARIINFAVVNPAPGGGTSEIKSLTVTNPVPTLSSLNPTSATAGGSGITLTVHGSNFVNTTKVRWNGSDRATTVNSGTDLTAVIPASDLINGGTAEIAVFTPGPGGGTTTTLPFTINNPVPAITSLTPNVIASGSSAFTLTVNGTGFVPSSVVRFNGSERATSYVSSTQLTALVTAADVEKAGTAKIRVFNPTPMGGLSSESDFTILQTNPVPTLTSLNPATVVIGSGPATLTLTGTNFVGTSVVRLNGNERATTFVSATELKATITAADLASVGTASLTVFNPAPGGGTTSALSLAINNPLPTITSLSQNAILKDSAGITLAVNGTNFVSTSQVQWNGANRATGFVSATQLTVTIPAADFAAAGTAEVTVVNPAPGGGTSNGKTFTINNPTPAITSLDPTSTYNTLPSFTLTVKGTGFVGPNASVVRWNGADRATTYVSATELKAAIPAADIADVGTAVVTVFNPTPGGGISNAVNFNIEKLTGYEGDVAPRPLGNNDGKVTIQDWVQLGRFFVGLDKLEIGSEFQRADCAPKETKGDGRLSITDWVQAGRFAIGLDAIVVAGGPVTPTAGLPTVAGAREPFASEAGRTVRAVNASFRRDQVNTLRIELDALGDENALAFSLQFDPKLFSFADASLGDGANGAMLSLNRTESAVGRIGFAIAMPTGQSFAAGTRGVMNIRLIPLAGERDVTTQITFSDSLVTREMANAFAQALPQANYINATINLTGRAAANVSAANYQGGELAADSIASAFGSQLATGTEGAGPATLPTRLAGTRVRITDSAGTTVDAPLFFVSPNQINYQIPPRLADGLASVAITNGDGIETKGLLNLQSVAPGLFSADASGTGLAAAEVVYVRSDNSQVKECIARFDANTGRFLAQPIDVQSGPTYLTLYGTGVRYRSELANVTARVDGIAVPVEYAGAQGQFVGLDQLNLRLPASLAGRGNVKVEVLVDGKAANPVWINLK